MGSKTVLITDYVWPSIDPEKEILSKYNVELIIAPNSNEETLIEMAKDVDGILTCFAKVTKKVVQAAKNCKVIGRYGVGVDNIDVVEATKQGIIVTYVPDYCVEEVADHVIALMLSWNRRIILHNEDTKNNGWGTAGLNMRIMRLKGKKLGIVGFGRIGKSVAQKARAFGLDILAFDPNVDKNSMNNFDATKVTLDKLLSESHFISLHSPLIEKTSEMINYDQFNQMREDAFLINCARGGLINEDALYEALETNKIAGAGLDVLVDINPNLNHRLIQHSKTIITPHTAFFSQEAVLELEKRASQYVGQVLIGEKPDNIINTEVLNNDLLRSKLN